MVNAAKTITKLAEELGRAEPRVAPSSPTLRALAEDVALKRGTVPFFDTAHFEFPGEGHEGNVLPSIYAHLPVDQFYPSEVSHDNYIDALKGKGDVGEALAKVYANRVKQQTSGVAPHQLYSQFTDEIMNLPQSAFADVHGLTNALNGGAAR